MGSVEEAIMRINEREKPLALYVFTQRPEVMAKFQAETSSGGLTINETLLQLRCRGFVSLYKRDSRVGLDFPKRLM